MQTSKTKNNNTIDHLNSFLRGELSAVETYRQAIDKLDRSSYRPTLEECRRSHHQRALLLGEEVRRRGGDPAAGSGAWGSFAKLVEGTAAVFGEKAAIAALEEGEDHGGADYRRDFADLDPGAQQFIQVQVLPEQHRTHDAIALIKKSMSS